jgi:prepilin-type N-terminal cleavage/methylation domain-containing protein
MPRNSGFTLIELLIAAVIFLMVANLLFFSFSQSISVWERADREVEKMDQIVFLNSWLKDLFHSAENTPIHLPERSLPIFFGNREKVLFITSNPILNKFKVVSLVQLEFVGRSLLYAEESLVRKDLTLFNPQEMTFDTTYPLLTDIDEGALSYLVLDQGVWTMKEEANSGATMTIPKAVKITLLYQGKKIEIEASILADTKLRDSLPRRDILL